MVHLPSRLHSGEANLLEVFFGEFWLKHKTKLASNAVSFIILGHWRNYFRNFEGWSLQASTSWNVHQRKWNVPVRYRTFLGPKVGRVPFFPTMAFPGPHLPNWKVVPNLDRRAGIDIPVHWKQYRNKIKLTVSVLTMKILKLVSLQVQRPEMKIKKNMQSPSPYRSRPTSKSSELISSLVTRCVRTLLT